MQSHTCQLQTKDWAWLLLGPLAALLLLSVLLHLGTWTGKLPPPRSTHDPDETILVHQADASRARSVARLILCGDSSCLMDVEARLLGDLLGAECLNLGTFSYLDLNAATWLVQEFNKANPGQLACAVVLMHPEALRQANSDPRATQTLWNYLQGLPPPPWPGLTARIQSVLGLSELRHRVLDRVLPVSFSGSFGRYYGFSQDLERFMTQHHGTAVDPESRPFRGNAEYGLAPALETDSQNFRRALGKEIRLVIGITPIPESFVPASYAGRRYGEMLDQWGSWIGADALLKSLPPTLPDACFAKTTHLNTVGMVEYTQRLAEALRPAWPRPPK